MMRNAAALLSLTAASLLAGCQERYLSVDDAGRKTAAPPAMSAASGAAAAPPAAGPSAVAGDTCGASALSYLIGKPKQQIPVAADLSRRRVVCATCDRPPDPDPQRATILFDAASGLVTAVRCE